MPCRCRGSAASRGYVINGAKAWCTFAGRANVLALLARTDPNPKSGARGLSLFIVPKDSFAGHSSRCASRAAAPCTARPTPPRAIAACNRSPSPSTTTSCRPRTWVGEAAGLNKGFYLQMNGFAAGRLQTGGRATGLSQAALERTAEYANDRNSSASRSARFGLTQHKLGRMATHVMAGRQLTYAAALAMDKDESIALSRPWPSCSPPTSPSG